MDIDDRKLGVRLGWTLKVEIRHYCIYCPTQSPWMRLRMGSRGMFLFMWTKRPAINFIKTSTSKILAELLRTVH